MCSCLQLLIPKFNIFSNKKMPIIYLLIQVFLRPVCPPTPKKKKLSCRIRVLDPRDARRETRCETERERRFGTFLYLASQEKCCWNYGNRSHWEMLGVRLQGRGQAPQQDGRSGGKGPGSVCPLWVGRALAPRACSEVSHTQGGRERKGWGHRGRQLAAEADGCGNQSSFSRRLGSLALKWGQQSPHQGVERTSAGNAGHLQEA